MKIAKSYLNQVIKEVTLAVVSENDTLAAFNQPSDVADQMEMAYVCPLLRKYMRDGEHLDPKSYINHMTAFDGGGVNSTLMAVIQYFEDGKSNRDAPTAEAIANQIRDAIVNIEEFINTNAGGSFKAAMQELINKIELELEGKDVENDPKADDVGQVMEKKLGKTTISKTALVALIKEEILGALCR